MREDLIVKMRAAYELQRIITPRQCPRRTTSAIILDLSLNPISTGRNVLPDDAQAPCVCNCGISTLKGASLSCRAIHAEAQALEYIKDKSTLGHERYIVTTSPPCKRCLPKIMESNISVIVTTDQYPDRDESEKEWPGTWIVLPYEECQCPDTER